MNAVMISINPKWVEKIAKGDKTIEVRKTAPSFGTPFRCYIYCTAGAAPLYLGHTRTTNSKGMIFTEPERANGMVVGEFVCNEITPCIYGYKDIPNPAYDGDDSVMTVEDGYWVDGDELEQAQLTYAQLEAYGKGKTLYLWHINELTIYNSLVALDRYRMPCARRVPMRENRLGCAERGCIQYEMGDCNGRGIRLNRPPQSWCRVLENGRVALQ